MIHVLNKYFFIFKKLSLVVVGLLLSCLSVYAQSETGGVAGTVAVLPPDLKLAADYALKSFRVNLQHGADVTADYLTAILGHRAIVSKSQAALKNVDSAIVSDYMQQTDSTQQASTQVPQVLDTVQQVLDYWVYPISDNGAYPTGVNKNDTVSIFPYDTVQSSGSLIPLVQGYRQLLYYQARIDNCVSTLGPSENSTSSGKKTTGKSASIPVLDKPCDSDMALEIIRGGAGSLTGGGASVQSLLATLAGQKDDQTATAAKQAFDVLHDQLSALSEWVSSDRDINLHHGKFPNPTTAENTMTQLQSQLNSLLPSYEKYLLQAIYAKLLDSKVPLAYPSLSTLLDLDSYATDKSFDCTNISSSSKPTNVSSGAQQFARQYLSSLSGNLAPRGIPQIPLLPQQKGVDIYVKGGSYKNSDTIKKSHKASGSEIIALNTMASNRAILLPQIQKDQQNYAIQLNQYRAGHGLAMDNLFQLYEQRALNYAGPSKSCTPMQLKRQSAMWRNGSETVDAAGETKYTWNQSMQMASPDVVQRQSLYLLAEIRQELFEMNQVHQRVLATLSAMQLSREQDMLQNLSMSRMNLEQNIKSYVAGNSLHENLAAKGADAVKSDKSIQNLGKNIVDKKGKG